MKTDEERHAEIREQMRQADERGRLRAMEKVLFPGDVRQLNDGIGSRVDAVNMLIRLAWDGKSAMVRAGDVLWACGPRSTGSVSWSSTCLDFLKWYEEAGWHIEKIDGVADGFPTPCDGWPILIFRRQT